MSFISSIASQVKRNCNISDAKFWGDYSPCGLLLRMRDLFRFESGLRPWQGIDDQRIRSWISDREGLWHDLDSQDYQPIIIGGKAYNPFDTRHINQHLSERGYVYGAGYGNSLKPMFLLARLSESRRHNGYLIYITGREIARDLSASPAMIRGRSIIVRSDTASLFLWQKFEEMKAMRCDGALHRAFSMYRLERESERKESPVTVKRRMQKAVRDELDAYLYHELGEASQRRYLGRWWKELLLRLPHSRAELFVRGIKDVLADTCDSGMLSRIIRTRRVGSLAFYVALRGGFRQLIFPEIVPAFSEFLKTGEWDIIEKTRRAGYRKTKQFGHQLRAVCDESTTPLEAIETKLISRLHIDGNRYARS